MIEIINFPKNFFWGAATSSHQVEGGNHNDWTEWEIENAKIKMQNAKLRNWPNYILENYPNPLQEENYISGRACDHYNRFHEDFDIAKQLGHNAHRFSIEWSRVEPEQGKFDEKEIEHYAQVLRALRERGMEPFVTLWHWTLPLWLSDKGGFKNKKIKFYFSRYVEKIANEFKNDVKFWITINEPEIYASMSYLTGAWPPQEKNILSYLKVLMNLIWAHRAAYAIIKKNDSFAKIGIAKNNVYFEAAPGIRNFIFKKTADFWWNFLFLNKTWLYSDFIGLNYYYHSRIDEGFNKNENKVVSDMGTELYSKGIYYVLKDLKKYKKPIFITENGIADAKDEYREKFMKENLFWIQKAISEGVDVQGYFHWSLLDNFEWDKGFWPRFGLVEIDYKTLERKARSSAYLYRDIILNNMNNSEL